MSNRRHKPEIKAGVLLDVGEAVTVVCVEGSAFCGLTVVHNRLFFNGVTNHIKEILSLVIIKRLQHFFFFPETIHFDTNSLPDNIA